MQADPIQGLCGLWFYFLLGSSAGFMYLNKRRMAVDLDNGDIWLREGRGFDACVIFRFSDSGIGITCPAKPLLFVPRAINAIR